MAGNGPSVKQLLAQRNAKTTGTGASSGGAPNSVQALIRQRDGSPAPAVTAAPSHKGGGGLFGGLKRAAHWTAGKTELAATDLKNIPGGLVQIGKVAAEPEKVTYDLIVHGHKAAQRENQHAQKQFSTLARGTVESTKQTVEHPLRDPFQTGLLATAVLSGGGSIAGRVAEAGRVAGEGGTVGDIAKAAVTKPPVRPRLLKKNGEATPLQPSKNPTVRAAQAVHDKVVQRAIDKNPEGRIGSYGTKRIGGSQDETARYQARMRAVPASALQRAATHLNGKLPGHVRTRVEQAALELTSVNTAPEDAARFHLAQAEKGVNAAKNRAVAKLYSKVAERNLLTKNETGDVIVNAADHPRLAKADLALAKVQGRGDEILTRYGIRTPEQLQEAVNKPGRYRAGATYEKPTPGKLGRETPGLKSARQRVVSLQGRIDRALNADSVARDQGLKSGLELKGPMRFHARSPQQMSQLRGALAVARSDLGRNERAAAARVKPTGVVGGNELPATKLSGYHGGPVRGRTVYMTSSKDLAAAYGADVTPISYYARRRLVISTPDEFRHYSNLAFDRFGATGSAANTPLAEWARENGYDAVTIARAAHPASGYEETLILEPHRIGKGAPAVRPGRGFVSYRSEEKRAPKNAAAGSPGPTVGEAKAPIDSHVNTGYNLAHGNVPKDITGPAARHYQQIVRFQNTSERRAAAIRSGSPVKQTSHDVLVRVPGVSHEKINPVINGILGKSKLTTDDIAGLHAALDEYRQELIPGLRDKFASDRHEGIGAQAPEGHVWVDRNILGDLAKPGPGSRGKIARSFDNINSAVTAATVYFKIGHVGTRALTNAATNIIQGSATPLQVAKSLKLWHAITDEDKMRALAAAGQHGFEAMPHEGVSVASKVAGTGARFWAHRFDAPFRFNSIAFEARKAGFDTPAKFKAMLAQAEDPAGNGLSAAQHAKVDWVLKRANREGIAYDRLSPFERQYIARGLWFYPWLKGTVGFAGNTLLEHPYKAAIGGQAGEIGRKQQAKDLGDLPSYERGLLKLGGSADHPLVADFSTFSPFATPADMLDTAAGKGNAADFLNPVYSAGVQLATHENSFGQHTNSPVTSALASLFAPTPEAQIVNAYLNRGKNQNRKMFKTTPGSALARALVGPGMPRHLNVHAAHSAAARQRTGR